MKNKCFSVVMIFGLILLSCSLSFAYDAEIDNCLHTFAYAEWQIAAAMTEMYMVLGWFPEDKGMMIDVGMHVMEDRRILTG